MRTFLIVTAVAVLLAGCSGDGEKEAEAAPSAPPTVSTTTTCGQLFDDEAPIEGVVDLMTKTTVPADANRARDFADDLESIGAQAGDELKPHLGVVVDELREFADTVDDLGSYDTVDMVTSLTELNNVCGVTPRF